jgi:hypothetical protein
LIMTVLVPPRSTPRPRHSTPVDLSNCLIVEGVSDRRAPSEGSELRPCSCCDEKIWLSPGGKRLLAANPDLIVVCVDCAIVVLDRPGYGRTRQGVRT